MAFFLLLGLYLFLFLGEGGARVSGGCLEEVDWLRLGDVRVDGGRCLSRCGWMSCVCVVSLLEMMERRGNTRGIT